MSVEPLLSRALLLVCAASALAAAGCSVASDDPFGPEPDFVTLEQRFVLPTGTLTEANAAAVLARYEDERRAAPRIELGAVPPGARERPMAAGGAAGVRSQALHLLALAETGRPTNPRCLAIDHGDARGSCACPEGGAFAYDFSEVRAAQQSRGPAAATLKVRFDACRSGDVAIDGREVVRLEVQGPGRDDRGDGERTRVSFVFADLTVERGGEEHAVVVAARPAGDDLELALQVGDGWISVRGGTFAPGSAGGFVLRDREATWTCTTQGTARRCTTDAGRSLSF